MSEQEMLTVKTLAGQNFKDGYNCAEAVLRAFNEHLKLDLPNDVLKIATGFGGGLGHAGCVCGALTASTMVLSLLQGRADRSDNRGPAYTSAEEFHHVFADNFGATCCRVLNPHPFETREHLRNCLKITGKTAELLMDYIESRKIVK